MATSEMKKQEKVCSGCEFGFCGAGALRRGSANCDRGVWDGKKDIATLKKIDDDFTNTMGCQWWIEKEDNYKEYR